MKSPYAQQRIAELTKQYGNKRSTKKLTLKKRGPKPLFRMAKE